MLPLNELRAAAIFASTDATRYILNGVYVQISKEGQITLAATDGRRACIIKSDALVTNPGEVAAFILPLRLIKRASPIRGTGNVELSAEVISEVQIGGTQTTRTRYRITLSDGETAVSGRGVDGNYPAYAQALPGKIKAANTHIMISPKFIGEISAVAKLLRPSKAKYDPAMVIGGEEETKCTTILLTGIKKFYCIVMPVRVDAVEEIEFGAPDWAKVNVLAPLAPTATPDAATAAKIGGGA